MSLQRPCTGVTKFDKYDDNGPYHWLECDSNSTYFNPPLIARYEVVLRQLQTFTNTSRVLDVGCGDAYLIAKIKDSCGTIVGMDPERRAVEIAQQILASYNNCRVIQGDCYHIPFEKNSFDVVLMTDVIEHLTQPIDSLKEIGRVMSRDGTLIITTPKFRPDRKWDERHEREFTEDEIRELLTRVFSDVQISFFWPLCWSRFYTTKIGWRVCKYIGRRGWNPFLTESIDRPKAFGQIKAVCRGAKD
jgi:SAM-dependent methyltransferase